MKTGFERLGFDITLKRADRMCLKKKPFDTRTQARDFSLRGAKRYEMQIQKPYKCSLCGKFHLATVKVRTK